MQDAHEVSQRQSIVSHNALYLVEFRQMCGIQCLVPEHPVDGEILDRGELLLLDKWMVWYGFDKAYGTGALWLITTHVHYFMWSTFTERFSR